MLNFSQQHNKQGGLFSPRAKPGTPISVNSQDGKKKKYKDQKPAVSVPALSSKKDDDECLSEIG